MWLWVLSFSFFFLSIDRFLRAVGPLDLWGGTTEKRRISAFVRALQEVQSEIESGVVVPASRWQKFDGLADPWGNLTLTSVQELRAQGQSILSTLIRIKTLAVEHSESLLQSQAKSIQSKVQSLFAFAVVPLFGAILYALLPELTQYTFQWCAVCGGVAVFSFLSFVWILKMAERAQWGGLGSQRRAWIILSQCAVESLMAQVKSGKPADLAWQNTHEWVTKRSSELAILFGMSVWADSESLEAEIYLPPQSIERLIADSFLSLKKTLQINLMEGRSSLERIQTLLAQLKSGIQSHIDRQLSLLPSKTLIPLFICVFPGVLSLVATALYWVGFSDAGI